MALLLSKTSAKVIAEQLTLRNWSAYSALAPSHLQTWRSRAVNNILNFIAQEIGTLVSKLRSVSLNFNVDLLVNSVIYSR